MKTPSVHENLKKFCRKCVTVNFDVISCLLFTSTRSQSQCLNKNHCVKSARIRSFCGPYFPAFGRNTERCEVSLCIISKCEKYGPEKLWIRAIFTQWILNRIVNSQYTYPNSPFPMITKGRRAVDKKRRAIDIFSGGAQLWWGGGDIIVHLMNEWPTDWISSTNKISFLSV